MTHIDTNKTYYLLLDQNNEDCLVKYHHGINKIKKTCISIYENIECMSILCMNRYNYYTEVKLLPDSVIDYSPFCKKFIEEFNILNGCIDTDKIFVDIINKKSIADFNVWNDYDKCLKIAKFNPTAIRFMNDNIKTKELCRIACISILDYPDWTDDFNKYIDKNMLSEITNENYSFARYA